MSFPEDGLSFSELRGFLLLQALKHAEFISSPRRENEAEEQIADEAAQKGPLVALSRRCLFNIAHLASQRLLASDLTALTGMQMGGETQYDVGKVKESVKALTQAVHDELAQQGKLETRSTETFEVDVYADRGRRAQMEDRHSVIEDFNAYLGIQEGGVHAFFGIYDGHGGVEAAKFLEAQLPLTIASQPTFTTDIREALLQGFLATDTAFLEKAAREAYNSGATACTVLIRDDQLYVAWLGDSQVMLCCGGETVPLMDPHKPNREDEKKRIEDSGGVVVWYGAWRVNGVLSVARAIGDRKLKQWVIGHPDINQFKIEDDYQYLVLGCDGLWDVLTPEKVVSLISEWQQLPTSVGVKGLAKYLVTHCLEDPSSSDNISIIVVALPKCK